MLDEAEGTQLEQKLRDKDTRSFNMKFFKSSSGTPIFLSLCTKTIKHGKCQDATKG